MPIYEYRCKACGQTFEELQKFSDPPLVDCPHCREAALEKIMSLNTFHLKGSGWYVTDYAGKNASTAGTAETPAPAEKKADSPADSASTPAKSGDKKE